MKKHGLNIVFSGDHTSSLDLWEFCHDAILEFGTSRHDEIKFNYEHVLLATADKQIIDQSMDDFDVEIANGFFRLLSNSPSTPMQLLFHGSSTETQKLAYNMQNLIETASDFIQASMIDYDFSYWQNQEKVSIFEFEGRNHSNLPKKSNGLPFPLEETIVDVSNNPGRWCFKDGFVEEIGCPMWLGDLFWEKTGINREKVLKQLGDRAEVLSNNIVKIEMQDHPFDDENDLNNPRELRRILYGN